MALTLNWSGISGIPEQGKMLMLIAGLLNRTNLHSDSCVPSQKKTARIPKLLFEAQDIISANYQYAVNMLLP